MSVDSGLGIELTEFRDIWIEMARVRGEWDQVEVQLAAFGVLMAARTGLSYAKIKSLIGNFRFQDSNWLWMGPCQKSI